MTTEKQPRIISFEELSELDPSDHEQQHPSYNTEIHNSDGTLSLAAARTRRELGKTARIVEQNYTTKSLEDMGVIESSDPPEVAENVTHLDS